MPTFISTIKFTQQGLKAIGETTERATALHATSKKFRVKIKDVYWTMGDHDGVLIFEAVDGEDATAWLLHVGAMGNVHTATSRAFTAVEMDKILTKTHG